MLIRPYNEIITMKKQKRITERGNIKKKKNTKEPVFLLTVDCLTYPVADKKAVKVHTIHTRLSF